MKQIKRDQPVITLAPIPPTEGGKFNGKMTNDVYTKSGAPSNSVAAIDGVLKGAGFTKVFTEDARFYRELGKFTPSDASRIFQSDILALSGTTRNTDSSLDTARQYKQYNPNGKVIVGGFGPSFEPDKWLLGGVDIVVRGEGDKTAPLVVRAITNGDSLDNIKGISYKTDGEIKHNDNNPLLTEKELSELPLPFYPDYIKKKRNLHTVNESRGCYGNCKFCCVTVAYKRTYRMKTPERIAAEVRDSRDGEAIFFTGDNLAPRQQRTASRLVAEKLIEEKLFRRYLAQIDASFAEDIDLVKTWKKAGLFAVFQGKESINSEALKNISKPFTAEESIKSTETLRKLGFFVHDMFVVGIDGDTPKTIENFRTFLRKDNKANSGQLLILTPFIGTPVGDEKSIFEFAKNESNLFDAQHLVTEPPRGFTCAGLQETDLDLHFDLFSNRHLLRTLFFDSRHLFYDPLRAFRLFAVDVFAHTYARKTISSMKKDPYYQNFLNNLRQIDTKMINN
jgi:radical SAM superfamily enzyme YgiQ (UPF0313 family)